MLLRRLEAYGFKSFAEKIELEFGQGVTAIVGPNGSGKSNISDAIRWALGEQSLRNLRGTKMEDVIFAGSTKRRPLGVAEVSLVFDNSDGKLPLDFNEVTITRRVFRSGDSEYYINKTACRLRDIHDMLADTGLGRESMTVIGQNKVDEILSSKPEERRLLFEEAAGITKYKHRKRDALRKLEDTEQNLIRVQDITTELESQLEPLKESAARTITFNKLNAELTACQATLLLERLEKADGLVGSAKLEQEQLTDRNIAATTRLTLAENEKETLTTRIAQSEGKIVLTEKAINENTTESERIESRNGVLHERMEQAFKAEARLNEEIFRITADRTATDSKLIELQSTIDGKQQQLHVIQEEVDEKNTGNEQLLADIRKIERQLDDGQEQSFTHLQQVVDERNALRMLERDAASLLAKQDNLNKEYNDYLNQQQELSNKGNQLHNERGCLESQRKEFQTQTEILLRNKTQLENQFNNLLKQEQQLAGSIQEKSSKLKVLTSMQHDLEGFGRAIKSILKSQSSWRNGICGAVAQLFTVPGKFVTAIEVALGGAQQYIVTDSDQTAKQAITMLKTQNLGRATFLPLNTIRVTRPREAERLAASQTGALGFAADVVHVAERYRPVVEHLLGRVIITETIDIALAIARNSGFSVRIVTLDGQLVNPGGSLTGGSTGRREASFFARNNEIDVLKLSLEKLKAERLGTEQEKQGLIIKRDEVNSQFAALETKCKEIELRQAEMAIHIERNKTDAQQCQLALNTIRGEIAECQQEITEYQRKITERKSSLIVLENEESSHKNQIAEWQNQVKVMRGKQQALNEELTDAKIKLSAFTQEIAVIHSSREQYKETLSSFARQLSRIENERQLIQAEVGQAQTELGSLAERKEKLQAEKLQLTETRQVCYAEKLQLLSAMQTLDKEIKELRRQSNEVQARLHEIELLIAKYGFEATNCRDQLTGKHGLTIEQAQAMRRSDSIEQLLKSIALLENQIAALGLVNPAAIDEYNKVQERYTFLQEQTDDLLRAKDYLTSIIKDIDTTMSRQFNMAFKAINQFFMDVFVRLFGGGRAELVLLDPSDVLTSGIDIIVQPPGKKLQNLTLLSGGERALTVIALLFAILTYRPAPFCVVDEIDAALDEVNVQRFSEFLHDYAQNTQFIVVTHRKGTMEAAGVLHGVTMEESGISRLVSVKFMDKAG
ncbi:chromosome segregation protein SMC [Sporomusa acidovorans]|uniref:Chromosome partition protein Smc n=1 Tax=Sporomusa acidovorans (strain ATCC 49682 / DSM 3132 / Mol) TaxID=1123286 RepID=A0ABZ3J2P0_SPOA4|nr:chromosome segregation protein SMC [Sporomusa acidovorans]OZC20012.1 chromosome partition protein Smc [Sporomusa acidovorans DSM 3132]SDD47624.1 condensin subunit Smc [Sporomusa acidovorans]